MLTDTEVSRIAGAVNSLRPDWPAASVATLIRNKLATRARRDVALALTWIACDSDTKTPARVLEAGPWWQAEAGNGSSPREQWDDETTCYRCHQRKDRHHLTWPDTHDFYSVAAFRRYVALQKADLEQKAKAGAGAARAALATTCAHRVAPEACGACRLTTTQTTTPADEETT